MHLKLTKHDRYVQKLIGQLRHRYDYLATNVPVLNSKRIVGEIDIYAVKGDQIDLYEVKCSHRIHKARHQLHRLRKLLDTPAGDDYFYCGMSGLLELIVA